MGTVQLGIPYGIANSGGQPDKDTAFSILQEARACGIALLDTGRAYGTSEEVIGAFTEKTGKEFDIVSKMPDQPNVSRADISGALDDSLKRLQTKSLYGYLIHDFKTHQENPHVWEYLVDLKKEKKVKKVGFSVYYPREIELLLDRDIRPDIVQLPFSVLDTRFSFLFSELKKRSIEIHVRSIFLQGAVFLPDDKLTGPLAGLLGSVRQLRQLSHKEGVPIRDLCLKFVANQPSVDQIVMGVDSVDQLKNNMAVFERPLENKTLWTALQSLAVNDERVVVPSLWNRKT